MVLAGGRARDTAAGAFIGQLAGPWAGGALIACVPASQDFAGPAPHWVSNRRAALLNTAGAASGRRMWLRFADAAAIQEFSDAAIGFRP